MPRAGLGAGGRDLGPGPSAASPREGLPQSQQSCRLGREANPGVLGRHRDGFARVPQFKYSVDNDPREVVRRTLEFDLALAGATLVAPLESADLFLDIEIGSISVTTDGALAGEETFGDVSLAVTVHDGSGRSFGHKVYREHFADKNHADPGLVGDGLTRALMQIVAALPGGPKMA